MAKINVTGTDITIIQIDNSDYISLTDMAHSQMEEHIIIKWLSLKSTIEYIGKPIPQQRQCVLGSYCPAKTLVKPPTALWNAKLRNKH
jgi:hypothetical protein